PITKEWPANWKTAGDELYNTDKMRPEAHPLLKVKSPRDGREHIVAWTNEVGKGRVFGTTLGHDDKTATDPDYQKLLARGLLWVCGRLPE
ncbi:MAG TPA: ThuA domain-containing protein, partial [Tepidisphaeraceae bacterium]|nr:ThuA domain-containing protein [Tepidisphaeraceae bacterium]